MTVPKTTDRCRHCREFVWRFFTPNNKLAPPMTPTSRTINVVIDDIVYLTRQWVLHQCPEEIEEQRVAIAANGCTRCGAPAGYPCLSLTEGHASTNTVQIITTKETPHVERLTHLDTGSERELEPEQEAHDYPSLVHETALILNGLSQADWDSRSESYRNLETTKATRFTDAVLNIIIEERRS